MSPLTKYVVETLLTLFGVIVIAVLLLMAARRVGVGKPGGPIRLVGRLPLDGRRAIYLVRVGQKVFVVGGSEAGLEKLGELPNDGLELPLEEEAPPAFAEVLARLRGQRRKAKRDEDPEEGAA
jgi:flagellar protein FliO/FliZ